MPFNPCPTLRHREEPEERRREGSHFEDHALRGRISECRNPGLTGSAVPLGPSHAPCPNHPRHPVLLDKTLFSKKQRNQNADVDAGTNSENDLAGGGTDIDGHGDAIQGDNADGGAPLTSQSSVDIHQSPTKKSSHFSLRSLPSRLFKKRERAKIDFHRLYTETSAAEIQHMQEEMSRQIQSMDEESRRVSLTIKNKERDDRCGSHFAAYNRKEWSKESADAEDVDVDRDNVDSPEKKTTGAKGKKREESGSQSQPATVLPGSTWKSLGNVVSRTPSRKLTETTADRTASAAGAVAASHNTTSVPTPSKDHQPSAATVIASVRAGTASGNHCEHDTLMSTEPRSSRADKNDIAPPGKDKSEKRSRSSKSRKKDHSNPFLAPSGNQIEETITDAPAHTNPVDPEHTGDPVSQEKPPSPRADQRESSAPGSETRTLSKKERRKERKRMKGSITEQLASLPVGEKPQEDTISVSRARTGSDLENDPFKTNTATPEKTPSRKVSLQAAKWESLMRQDRDSPPPPIRAKIKTSREGSRASEDKKSGENVYIPPHLRERSRSPAKDVPEKTKTLNADDTGEETGESISKSNQQQPPVAPGLSDHHGHVGFLAEAANNVPADVEKVQDAADTNTDVDVADVEVEDDEGESVHMCMSERLKIRKNRVASGLDKVFKGIQKRALSAARSQNAQLQALLGQEKKKGSEPQDQIEQAETPEPAPTQQQNPAWLTDGRRKGFGYQFINEEQAADATVAEGDVSAGMNERDAGNDSDKENTGPLFYTPVPPHERERPEVPSYSWPGRSGATDDSTGAEPEATTIAGISADSEAEIQESDKKPEKERRWFSVGNGSFRNLVSKKMSDVIRASPISIQRALSNTSLAASMLTTLSDQMQGDLSAPNHSVRSRSASIRTGKSNKSNLSLVSIEQNQVDPVFSPPPRICSPEETKLLSANGVYSFGEDLERQLSSINLSDIDTSIPKEEDTAPRPRTATTYTLDPTDTDSQGAAQAGPRNRTPHGAGPNAAAILRPRSNTGSSGTRSRTGSGNERSRGLRSRTGTGSSVSGRGGDRPHPNGKKGGQGVGGSSLYPPALHPRSRRSSLQPPAQPDIDAVGGSANNKKDIAMNQDPDVRDSTAAFRERQIADGAMVKEQLLNLVNSTWPDEQ